MNSIASNLRFCEDHLLLDRWCDIGPQLVCKVIFFKWSDSLIFEGSSVPNVGCYHLVKRLRCLPDFGLNLEVLRLWFEQGFDLYFRPCISLTISHQVPKAHELIVNYWAKVNNRKGHSPYPIVLIWNMEIYGEAQPLMWISGDGNLSSPGVHSDTNMNWD